MVWVKIKKRKDNMVLYGVDLGKKPHVVVEVRVEQDLPKPTFSPTLPIRRSRAF